MTGTPNQTLETNRRLLLRSRVAGNSGAPSTLHPACRAAVAQLGICQEIMKITKVAVLAMLLAATAFSKAEGLIDPVEVKLEELAKQSPKLNLPKLLDYNLKKLDAVYQASLKAAEDAEHRKALEDSHKAWLAFFEADGAVAAWNAKGGSYAYPAQIEQRIYQLRLRMYQLTTPFLQGWSEVPRTANPEAKQVSGGDGG